MTRPKKERKVIVCDELDFSWHKEQTVVLLRLHKEGKNIQQIASRFRRPKEEILIALIGLLPQHELAEMLRDCWGVKNNDKPKKFECID
ncbi:hypothetical protein [Paenibacillus sinopodophylli]|uniref:hypothetical protein n=1 Tax=Paenibacillus sinopodophylli TaxID=1837342 RepID=UPI00110D1752|nr:hypothetical protein [Paenibacillus sinopodophylli]